MTPAGQAKEIIGKYKKQLDIEIDFSPYYIKKHPEWENRNVKSAKQCAIIHVQGIIDAEPLMPLTSRYHETISYRVDEAKQFWQQVLNEINKQ